MDVRKLVAIAILIVGFTFLCIYLGPRLNPIPPKRMAYAIEAGEVSRGIIASATRETGRAPIPIPPHHLEFTSSNGPVEVFIARLNFGVGADGLREMEKTTALLREGKTPPDVVAQKTGESGRIHLHSWPLGNARYILYLRPIERSEVTVVVHYSP